MCQVLGLQDALGAQIGFLPVSLGQAVQLDRAARGWRVDEAAFADVDPGVADLGAAIGGEENQVTGLQAFLADIGGACMPIISRVERGKEMPATSRYT